MNIFPSFVIDKRRYYSKNSTQLFLIVSNSSAGNSRIRVNSNSIQILLIGLCIGITLGVALIPLFEIDCFNLSWRDPRTSALVIVSDNLHDIRNDDENSNRASDSKKLLRPRFFSTELGVRKKLLGGILVTDFTNVDRVIAINKTLGPFVDQLLFFVVGQKASLRIKDLGISGVVTLSSRKNDKSPLTLGRFNSAGLRVIKYLGEKFTESYDFFYVGVDSFYVNGVALKETVSRIGVHLDVYWGQEDGENSGICSTETGVVLSRSVLRKLSSRLDRCLTSVYLQKGDIMRNCMTYLRGTTPFSCSGMLLGQPYPLASILDAGISDSLFVALVIGPITDAHRIYEIHEIISERQEDQCNEEIEKHSNIITKTTSIAPTDYLTHTWPFGLTPSHKSHTRFDVLKWKYFTTTQLFPKDEHNPESDALEMSSFDVSSVYQNSIKFLSEAIPGNSFIFRNGYRRFDEARGMEYILDFSTIDEEVIHRIECVRPLSIPELVPMPFVTETRRVTIVIPITSLDLQEETNTFLTEYFNYWAHKKVNSVVVFAIILKSSVLSPTEAAKLQAFKKVITDHNANHSRNNGEFSDVKVGQVVVNMRQYKTPSYVLAVLDMLSNNILSQNTLVLTLSGFVNITEELLNRVRMNTVRNYHVFSPIPFTEYDPEFSKNQISEENGSTRIEIHKSTGYFDTASYGYFSFFISDYTEARKRFHSNGQNWNASSSSDIGILHRMFLQESSLHFLRAPEPSLVIRFRKSIYANCSKPGDECFSRKWGSKSQLANLILSSASG